MLGFFSSRKQLDPESFSPERVGAISTAGEAAQLLRQATESKNDDYVAIALGLVHRLCSEDDRSLSRSVALGEAGVCSAVDALLGQKMHDALLAKSCLQVMLALTESSSARPVSEPSSLSAETVSVSVSVTQQVLSLWAGKAKTTSSSSSSSTAAAAAPLAANVARLSSSGTLFRVIKAAHTHVRDAPVLAVALRCLLVFAKDTALVSKLVACGITDLVGQALSTHGVNHTIFSLCSSLVHAVCAADTDELDGKNKAQDKFADKGVCEVLAVQGLAQCADFPVSCVAAIVRALGSLCRKHSALQRRLALSGTGEALAQCLSRCPSFIRDKAFAESLAWCVANFSLGEDEIQMRLGEIGMCAVMVQLVTEHAQESASLQKTANSEQATASQLVLQEALRALRNLVLDCEPNAVRAQMAGVVRALLTAFRTHCESPAVLQWVLFAMSGLVVWECCDEEMLREQVCPEIIAALARYIQDRDFVEWSGGLLQELGRREVYAAQLCMHHSAPVLVQALSTHSSDSAVVEEMLSAMCAMVSLSAEMRDSFLEHSVVPALLRVCALHEADEVVAEQVFFLLAHLCLLAQDLDVDNISLQTGLVSGANRAAALHGWHSLPSDRACVRASVSLSQSLFLGDALLRSEQKHPLKMLCRVACKFAANDLIARSASALLVGLLLCTHAQNKANYPAAAVRNKPLTDTESANEWRVVVGRDEHAFSLLRIPSDSSSSHATSSLLTILVDSGAQTTLLTLLGAHPGDTTVVRPTMLGLLQLCAQSACVNALRESALCAALPQALHMHSARSRSVTLLVCALAVQLCIERDTRVQLSRLCVLSHTQSVPQTQPSHTHVVLTALAQHVTDALTASALCACMSALCVSPTQDALTVAAQLVRRVAGNEGLEYGNKYLDSTSSSFLSKLTSVVRPTTSHTTSSSAETERLTEGETEVCEEVFSLRLLDAVFSAESTSSSASSSSQSLFSHTQSLLTQLSLSAGVGESGLSDEEARRAEREREKRALAGEREKARRAAARALLLCGALPLLHSVLNTHTQSLTHPNELTDDSTPPKDSDNSAEEVSVPAADRSEELRGDAPASSVSLSVSRLLAAVHVLNALQSLSLSLSPEHRLSLCESDAVCTALRLLSALTHNHTQAQAQTQLLTDTHTNTHTDTISSHNAPTQQSRESETAAVSSLRRCVRVLCVSLCGSLCVPTVTAHTHTSQTQTLTQTENESVLVSTRALSAEAVRGREKMQSWLGATQGVTATLLALLAAPHRDTIEAEDEEEQRREDRLLCEASFRAVLHLCDGLPTSVRVSLFPPTRTATAVLAALHRHAQTPRVVYFAALAVAALSAHSDAHCEALGAAGVCAPLVRALVTHRMDASVCESVCVALWALKGLQRDFGECGACEAALGALTTHAHSAAVCESVCKALGALLENESNKSRLDAMEVCRTVTHALQRHLSVTSSDLLGLSLSTESNASSTAGATSPSGLGGSVVNYAQTSAGIAQWSCTAMFYLCRGREGHNFREKLRECGACEAVARALLRFYDRESVSQSCCRALVVLTMESELWQSRLGGMGICACVVETLRLFPSSLEVAKWGCRAVAVLAESHEQNITRLATAGACETIPLVLQAHPNSESVASAGCDVVAFMCETLANGLAARFGHAGACEAVVSVVQKHVLSVSVCSRACVALSALARVPGNSRWFGPTGACEALLSALRTHGDAHAQLAQCAATACASLCSVAHNRERLGAQGGCELLVHAAVVHVSERETARACATAVWRLCEPQSIESSLTDTECETHSDAHTESDAFSEEALCEDDSTKEDPHKYVESHSNNAMSKTRRSSVANTTSEVQLPLQSNRDRLFNAGVCACVTELLRTHLSDAHTAAVCVRCVAVLAQQSACRRELGRLGACELVCAALRRHCLGERETDALTQDLSASATHTDTPTDTEPLSQTESDAVASTHTQRVPASHPQTVSLTDSHSESVARWGARALQTLCHTHAQNQQRCFHGGAIRVLAILLNTCLDKVTRDHSSLSLSLTAHTQHSLTLLASVVLAVTALSRDYRTAQHAFSALPVTLNLLSLCVMCQKEKERDFHAMCVRALLALSEDCSENALILAFAAQTPDALTHALARACEGERERDREALSVCALCVCVARERVGQARLGAAGLCVRVCALLGKLEKALQEAHLSHNAPTHAHTTAVSHTQTHTQSSSQSVSLSLSHTLSLTLCALRLCAALAAGNAANQDRLGYNGACKNTAALLVRLCGALSVLSAGNAAKESRDRDRDRERRPSVSLSAPAQTQDREKEANNTNLSSGMSNNNDIAVSKNNTDEGSTERERDGERRRELEVLIAEALQTIFHLCSGHDVNRQRVAQGSAAAVDSITELAAAQLSQDRQVLDWAKQTLDLLIGTTQCD